MPDNKDLKIAIQTAIAAFEKKPLAEASFDLLGTLGYHSDRRQIFKQNSAKQFQAEFDANGCMNPDAALVSDWKSVDLLIQIADDEIRAAIKGMTDAFASKKVDNKDIRSYLFFAVELNGKQYTRTQLAGITREINKLFPMPVMVIFKYDKAVSLAIIARRINKKDGSKDVLEKVTLIKDIRFTGNRAQIEILHDLAIAQLIQDHEITNFVDLQKAWEQTLDLNELNKKFYREIANWYFWAVKTVKFPKDTEKDESTRNATSVIRLITRLIFVWFIKEKGLVPEALFDERWLKDNLDFSDVKKSTYYKAILQNLFFATLNTEMGAGREFRRENAKGQDPDYLMSNFYRYKRYFKDPDTVLNLFAQIPFLNGGLFECLDKEIEKGTVIRVDGFSDRDDNPLQVPDDLFLMEKEKEIDLNEVYGTKNKKYKVRGLIHIFNSYKFTIEENTPIEEEIALDPELLGKVFENLLAAYNPETGTTARKQTGSFYTPREIVNYMVDEALIAYLETALKYDGQQKTEDGERLRQLLAYTPDLPEFSDAEKTQLIAAIDNVKVLDPAAGSGAFPMGMLHKLVFLLTKLDPDNEGWKRKQISKANEIQDAIAREAAIRSIEEVFTENHDDYGRKLYLIENCIYGVDIQPIAVQIAKLRFFISLVVDQKTNIKKPNLGIRPLPNLETKFVAANSLIGIQRPDKTPVEEKPASNSPEIEEACELLVRKLEQYLKSRNPDLRARYIQEAQEFADVINVGMGADFQPLAVDWIFTTAKDTAALKALLPVKREAKASPMILRNQQIEEKEKELELVRREHFSARTPKSKRQAREKDKQLRNEIADLLSKNHALADETAQQLAGWDPYNQNAHADFFDTEWMFGFDEGFHIVIGNPPWGADLKETDTQYLSKRFSVVPAKTKDSYFYFISQSLQIMREKGFLAFIIPNTWLLINNAKEFRKDLLSYKVLEITDYGDGIFQHATVESATLLLIKEKDTSTPCHAVRIKKGKTVVDHSIDKKIWLQNEQCRMVLELNSDIQKLFSKLQTKSYYFEENCTIIWGIKPYQVGYGIPPQTQEMMEKRIYHSTTRKGKDWKPLLVGTNVNRYIINFLGDQYIKYGEWLMYPSNEKLMQNPKILLRQTSDILRCCYDEEGYYCQNSVFIVHSKTIDLKFLLGLLNSTLLGFVYKMGNPQSNKVFAEIKPSVIKKLPIYNINQSDPREAKYFKQIKTYVEKILAAKRADPQANTSPLEGEIDQLVYQLYGLAPEEIDIVKGKEI